MLLGTIGMIQADRAIVCMPSCAIGKLPGFRRKGRVVVYSFAEYIQVPMETSPEVTSSEGQLSSHNATSAVSNRDHNHKGHGKDAHLLHLRKVVVCHSDGWRE